GVGAIWTAMYVNAVPGEIDYSRLPVEGVNGSWGHVHLEIATGFTDDVNLFSKTSSGDANYAVGCLAGALAEVYIWERTLSVHNLQLIMGGFNHDVPAQYLIGYFQLEEGTGHTILFDWTERNNVARIFNGPTEYKQTKTDTASKFVGTWEAESKDSSDSDDTEGDSQMAGSPLWKPKAKPSMRIPTETL
ncbi:hypothetical protein CYMTET_19365, partial [Cymbomonas tetramitiformis]